MTEAAPRMGLAGAAPSSLDANVLLCALDAAAPVRQQAAIELLKLARFYEWPLAGQVVGEVFRRVQGRGWQWSRQRAKEWVDVHLAYHAVLAASSPTYRTALDVSSQTGRPFWDCLIIATCAAHGVKRLYTEGAGAEPHGLLGVELVNPFLTDDWHESFE